ncbi:hypothetical protein DL95DRAFT_396562, partial [Leptodontidium sp. 2 PMI_412]
MMNNFSGTNLLDPLQVDKDLRFHLKNLIMSNKALSNVQGHHTNHFSLHINNMLLIAAIFLLILALAVILATQRLPSLHPWTRCWQQTSLRTTKQPPCDAETKILQDVKPYQF